MARRKNHKKGMTDDQIAEVIGAQLMVINEAIRSLVYSRTIRGIGTRRGHFWVSTNNAHIQSFITAWSKCFGSKKDDTHWTKTTSNRQDFKRRLQRELDLNGRSFKNYFKSLLTIRNKVVSHTDLTSSDVFIPNLEQALDSLRFFHGELRKELQSLENLSTATLYRGPCLDMWIANLTKEAEGIISAACIATQDIDEFQ